MWAAQSNFCLLEPACNAIKNQKSKIKNPAVNWSLITATNNDAVLQSCLANSPCFHSACDFQAMRGAASAGIAYNAGLRKARGEIVVFAHQDMYLPEGWDQCLAEAVRKLSISDPDWGVLGVWGFTGESKPAGHSYCTGLQKVLGRPFETPLPCISLDEALLVLRRSSGLAFDEQLPGFHLYGTDICLTARQKAMNCYVIPAFCIHNTAGLKFLPWAFWRAYLYMRAKWWRQLPLKTPCTTIARFPTQLIEDPLRSAYAHYLKRRPVGNRVPDPHSLYQELVRHSQRTCPSIPATMRADLDGASVGPNHAVLKRKAKG